MWRRRVQSLGGARNMELKRFWVGSGLRLSPVLWFCTSEAVSRWQRTSPDGIRVDHPGPSNAQNLDQSSPVEPDPTGPQNQPVFDHVPET